MGFKRVISICMLLMLLSCVEEYELPETASNLNLLVVDGGLNIKTGTAILQLTRSQNLGDQKRSVNSEVNAIVYLEDRKGNKYKLNGQGGTYTAIGLPLVSTTKYRLLIQTASASKYESTWITGQLTPEIDNLSWLVEGDRVRVEVNTHDPSNNSKYYRWDYIETYEYWSPLTSEYDFINGEIIKRNRPDAVRYCWKTSPSANILVGTTDQLQQDVISKFPLTFHKGNSEQMSKKYHILVRQYAVEKEEYEYWQILKKNTEVVGSLFDAQPSQVIGNISNPDNPNETVLGFFGNRQYSERSMFITAEELRPWSFQNKQQDCPFLFTEGNFMEHLNFFLGKDGKYLIFGPNGPLLPNGQPTSYTLAPKECIDCRLKGGTTQRPPYW